MMMYIVILIVMIVILDVLLYKHIHKEDETE